MKSLLSVLNTNRNYAIKYLQGLDGNIINFESDAQNQYKNDFRPLVIVDDNGSLVEVLITKASLQTNGKLNLYVDDWQEWITDDMCLSYSANNVYLAIHLQIMSM